MDGTTLEMSATMILMETFSSLEELQILSDTNLIM